MDARITVEIEGERFEPSEFDAGVYINESPSGTTYREVFPFVAFMDDADARASKDQPPLAAEPGWEERPFARRQTRTLVTFAVRGPDAQEALGKIKGVMTVPPFTVFGFPKNDFDRLHITHSQWGGLRQKIRSEIERG